MTPEQLSDLNNQSFIICEGGAEVVSENMTFPARGEAAAEVIMAKAKQVGAEFVAGVFPAHVAVSLREVLGEEDNPLFLLCPVAVPAAAKEGEVRGGGFVHSHWELFCYS
jgi:hypothetical protein